MTLVPADVLAAYELDLTIPTAPGFSVGSIQGLMAPQSFISEGIELELAGAITPNWNVFMNISKQESTVSNIADSAFELASEIAAKAKANGVWEMRQSPSVGSAITVGQQLTNNFLVPLAGAKTREGTVAAEQRKWRMNLTSTYKFIEGKMKGLGFGGALRWQDAAATGYRLNINSEGIQVPDLNSPFYGPEEFNGDVWVNYRRPLKDGKIDWKVQLNVRNLIGDSDMIPVVTNPDGRVAISRNPNPKEVFLTNTFSF